MIINECHTIENRMDVVSQQTFEIFRSTIKNQENIWLPSRNENLFDIQDLSENIREKLLLYPDLDYVFAYRPDSFIVSRMQSNGGRPGKDCFGRIPEADGTGYEGYSGKGEMGAMQCGAAVLL